MNILKNILVTHYGLDQSYHSSVIVSLKIHSSYD